MAENIKEHLDTLRELLPQLRDGRIQAIEFGDPNHPLGFMSHHRLQIINTPGGYQFCFKPVMRGMLGSGNYLGSADDRTLEIEAQKLLDHYFRPTLNPRLADKLRQTRNYELKYFPIQST